MKLEEQTMKCPKCSAELIKKTIQTIEVDECKECKGIWFDKDELRRAKDLADPDLNWMDFEIWKHPDKFQIGGKKYTCPRCDVELFTLKYANTDVEIEFCEKCGGTWLDKDEFKRIISALEKEMISKSREEYVKAAIEEAKEIITGPESFISEWKDFSTILRMLQYRILTEHPKLHDITVDFHKMNPIK